ncbi:hypoxanthine phosphoribosyltransferase [Thalassoglobus sp. JC818]|uniref:hypoxanthine phosphoribosyltransferase n=1 Tax=Thalassoglobus sp. JC818 TaxID=3232136 RepID=UPI00345A5B04
MHDVRCLISESEIHAAVERLGHQISDDFVDSELTVLGILTGSIVLVTDLMRRIAVRHQLGLIQASSYRGETTHPGELIINLDTLPEIRGRDVLIVDDIFDTGRTMTKVQRELERFQPRRIRSAVLLWKKSRTEGPVRPDYHCFEIPDEFVVGYGLDYNGEYRHLPYIGVLPPQS